MNPVGLRHALHEVGKPLVDDDARKRAYDIPKAMTALCNQMKAQLTQQSTYARYDATILASQKAGATTTIPVQCMSCGDDVPSITVTFKSAAHVTGVLEDAVDIITKYDHPTKEITLQLTATAGSYKQLATAIRASVMTDKSITQGTMSLAIHFRRVGAVVKFTAPTMEVTC
jgi:hypothetical protein